jgi:uncharacterized protein (TIGR03790 family)
VPASVEIAEHYQALRGIPQSNVVTVDVAWSESQWSMSEQAFRETIYAPVSEALRERGLDEQVLGWVYSVGFPTRIDAPQPVSLHGITFVRGKLPSADDIYNASYHSPLFAGGGHENMRLSPTQSLDGYADWLGDEMPLPAMSLGVVGKRGSTVENVRKALTRAVRSDATLPDGPIYLIDGDDVRIICRKWQFGVTANLLKRKQINVQIARSIPEKTEPLVGIFTGIAKTTPSHYSFVPGALADNLTSFAGAFERAEQTKLTEWLDAGAVASLGAVVEPMSNYRKFPVAQIFVHYTKGCTVMEAYYQSILSPLQQLIVGDPLAAPFAYRTAITCSQLPAGAVVEQEVELEPAITQPLHYNRRSFDYLMDGGRVGSGKRWKLDPKVVTAGKHTLRIVAFTYGVMRSQSFVDIPFSVKK